MGWCGRATTNIPVFTAMPECRPALHGSVARARMIAGFVASGANMEFTALFLATVIVMLAAWRGSRPLALGLFAALLIASVATYLHHATDALKLSF